MLNYAWDLRDKVANVIYNASIKRRYKCICLHAHITTMLQIADILALSVYRKTHLKVYAYM